MLPPTPISLVYVLMFIGCGINGEYFYVNMYNSPPEYGTCLWVHFPMFSRHVYRNWQSDTTSCGHGAANSKNVWIFLFLMLTMAFLTMASALVSLQIVRRFLLDEDDG